MRWEEDLQPWIFEAWHFILSRGLGLPHDPPFWLKQPAVMTVPMTTPQVLDRLGRLKNDLRPFTVVNVPFPKKETNQLWTGYFIMPYTEKLNDLHGRPMVNREAVSYWREDTQRQMFKHLSGALTDGGQQTQVSLRRRQG